MVVPFDLVSFPVVHHTLSLGKLLALYPKPWERRQIPGGFVLRIRLRSQSSKNFIQAPWAYEADDHKVSDVSVNVKLRSQAFEL